MKRSLAFLTFLFFLASQINAQNFAEKCEGHWSGIMQMYAQGINYDSIPVKLLVESTEDTTAWIWRTEYHGLDTVRVKDYILRHPDRNKNLYITDEGEDIELMGYLYNNKLYNIFDTEGIMLTSSYELLPSGELLFEVNSGELVSSEDAEVRNYSVNYLQRVFFKKED